jgi:hypothetical protein
MSGLHTSDPNNPNRMPISNEARDTAMRLQTAIEVLNAKSPITVKDADLEAKLDTTFELVLDANNRLDAANHYLTQMKSKQESCDAASCLGNAANITMHLTLALIRAKYDQGAYCSGAWTLMNNAMRSLILNPLTDNTNSDMLPTTTLINAKESAATAIAKIVNAAVLLVGWYSNELESSTPGDINIDQTHETIFSHKYYNDRLPLKEPYYITRIAMKYIEKFENGHTN